MAYFPLYIANVEWCQDHRILHISIRHCCQLVLFFHSFSVSLLRDPCGHSVLL